MKQHFENLDQVETFMKENAPDWKLERGKKTFMTGKNRHASNYEVLQIFKPTEDKKPFAEFWLGYYKSYPDSYESFFGPAYARGEWYFSCMGNLDFAIEAAVMPEIGLTK